MDEVWWSRFALPGVRGWSSKQQPLRLNEKVAAKDDAEPKALACYGIWCERQKRMLLRFVTGRPVSHVTTEYLAWVGGELWQDGHKVLVLIWDNASWHVSAEVRDWISAHNAAAKASGAGIRIIVVGLPTKSPWLNNIEPKWKHGKEAIVEPERSLTAAELEERVCAYYDVSVREHLVQRPPEPGANKESAVAATATVAGQQQQPAQTAKPKKAA